MDWLWNILIPIIQFIIIAVLTGMIYIDSFLRHELMHIKSQGPFATGHINVNKLGMTCGCNDTWNGKLFLYSGGVLSSIFDFLFVTVTTGWIQWCFLTMGWLQLCYGIYEGGPYNLKYRFWIYGIIISIMVILWIIKCLV